MAQRGEAELLLLVCVQGTLATGKMWGYFGLWVPLGLGVMVFFSFETSPRVRGMAVNVYTGIATSWARGAVSFEAEPVIRNAKGRVIWRPGGSGGILTEPKGRATEPVRVWGSVHGAGGRGGHMPLALVWGLSGADRKARNSLPALLLPVLCTAPPPVPQCLQVALLSQWEAQPSR